MKKSLKITLIALLFLLSIIIPCFAGVVFADSTIIANSGNGIADSNLYMRLLQIANDNLPSESQITQLYEDSLVGEEILNLSNVNIASITGLNKLNLSTVKEINLSYNFLTSFSGADLIGASLLTNLNISNNRISRTSFNGITTLKEMNASNNKIENIDLSAFVGGSADFEKTINLNNNAITSLDNIRLPSDSINAYNIDLRFNNLTSFTAPAKHRMDVGLQNVHSGEQSTVGKTICCFDVIDSVYTNFNVKIYANLPTPELYSTLNATTQSIELTRANVYSVKYYDGETEITGNTKYTPFSFTIKPNMPSVVVKIGEQEYTAIEKLTQESTMNFATTDGYGSLYYKINNADWVLGNSVQITESNNYNFKVKVVDNGLESEELVFSISLVYPADSIKQIIGIVILALIMVVLAYLAIKYRKGIRLLKKNAKANKKEQ